jgi:hypothetical protein
MSSEKSTFTELLPMHEEAGRALFAACGAELLPCDLIAFAMLNRSVALIKGFEQITSSGGYMCAVGILRMQLDNLLRFNGIALTADPHETAAKIYAGEELRKIKDDSGKPMNDARLQDIFATRNPWVKEVYKLASGYVHFSREHIAWFLTASPETAPGTRNFCIDEDEKYVEDGYKASLRETFIKISRMVPRMVNEWAKQRHQFGSNDDLKKRFSNRQ